MYGNICSCNISHALWHLQYIAKVQSKRNYFDSENRFYPTASKCTCFYPNLTNYIMRKLCSNSAIAIRLKYPILLLHMAKPFQSNNHDGNPQQLDRAEYLCIFVVLRVAQSSGQKWAVIFYPIFCANQFVYRLICCLPNTQFDDPWLNNGRSFKERLPWS